MTLVHLKKYLISDSVIHLYNRYIKGLFMKPVEVKEKSFDAASLKTYTKEEFIEMIKNVDSYNLDLLYGFIDEDENQNAKLLKPLIKKEISSRKEAS